MAGQPRPTACRHGVPGYSLAVQRAQGRTNPQATHSPAGHRHCSSSDQQTPSTQRLTIKQEELDAANEVDVNHVTQVDAADYVDGPPFCHRHKKSLEYIHRPRTADSAPKYKRKKIHLKDGQYIVRGKNLTAFPFPTPLKKILNAMLALHRRVQWSLCMGK